MSTLKRLKEKVVVTTEMVKPTSRSMKAVGAFNPGAAEFGSEVVLLVRVAEAAAKKRDGYKSSPRFAGEPGRSEIIIDWSDIAREKAVDKKTGRFPFWQWRLNFVSHLRLARLSADGFTLKYLDDKPTFYPECEWESFGVEDCRITPIEGSYYVTYVAIGLLTGVATALAKTDDFKTFKRLGIIFPQSNKDVVLFPEKINGRYYALHRPMPQHSFSEANIQIASSPDLEHWGHTEFLMGTNKEPWSSAKVGAGAPPIKTKDGWLEIYHGVNTRESGGSAGTYSAGALLLDLNNPSRIITRTKHPILIPQMPYEINGYVGHVVFPEGIVRRGDSVIIYSGCADTCVSAVEVSLNDIFNVLK